MAKFHKLSRHTVEKKVPNRIGVYRLYKSKGGPVRYVGSTGELKTRLLDYAGKGTYRYFKFDYAETRERAYKKEGRLYHAHGEKERLDNERHPRRPTKRVKCPGCSLHD
jgi:hypothetical protein